MATGGPSSNPNQSYPTGLPEGVDECVKNAMKWAQHFVSNGVDFEQFMDQHKDSSKKNKHHGKHFRKCPYMGNYGTAWGTSPADVRAAAQQVPEVISAVMDRVFDWLQPVDPATYHEMQSSSASCGHQASASQTQQSSTSGGKFSVTIDVTGFKPENISVKIIEDYLIIDAKKENTDGKVIQHVSHKYLLPADLDQDTIRSIMRDDKFLVVEGKPQLKQKEIPVQIIRGSSSAGTSTPGSSASVPMVPEATGASGEKSSSPAASDSEKDYEKVEKRHVEMQVD